MVSAGYAATARPQAHHFQPPAVLQQSQTQYLKEAFGLSPAIPPSQPSNETEWPSLNNAMFDPDRCASQQRGMARRTVNPMQVGQQQLTRRPASIGRVGINQQESVRNIGAVQQQMSALQLQKQAQQQAINNANNSSGGAPKNPKLYKTELCRSWADCGRCNYGERCQYAHGDSEKRPIPRHPKYKTEACQSYHQSGYCAYGTRCHFIHNEEGQVLAQMVAANAASKQQQLVSQSPIRPSNLFTSAAAVGICSSPTIGSPQRGTPVNNMGPIGSGSNPNAIARVAELAASAYNQNPNFFSHQFQTQLQIFNEGVKTEGNVTPTQPLAEMGSTGESPIPSSNDSGTESPICSFSPGSELDDPAFFFVRKQLEAKNSGPKLQQNAPINLLPSSLSSDVESGFSSSSSTSSGTKSLNSPVVGSPPHLASTNTMWSSSTVSSVGTIGTPTSAARLPVFERLSNGP